MRSIRIYEANRTRIVFSLINFSLLYPAITIFENSLLMLLELFSNLEKSHISLPFQNIKHLVLSNKDEILTKTIMKALFKMLKIKITYQN
jgi:hypothetical protein